MTAVWAHRGSTAGGRENTLAAFRAARLGGADGVELDVRSSADGVLVVHHDAALDDGRFIAHTRAADLPGWLPSLEAVLEECGGLMVDVEVKNLPTEVGYDPEDGIGVATARLVRRMGVGDGVVISAFAISTIDAARATAPEIGTGWLTLAGYGQLDALALAAERGHRALHPRHEAVTDELVAAAHGRGMAVHTWTVDDVDRIRLMADAGVDAVITNVTDVAVAVVGRSDGHRRPGEDQRGDG
ncbi:MAG: glycerophosphodiester phosphodiesterase [Acidimicrobiales bacterium]